MKKDEVRYLLFPIVLLQELNIKEVCRTAFYYGIYRKALEYAKWNDVCPRYIKQSMDYLDLSGNNLELIANQGKLLFDTYSNCSPMVSINIKRLQQYHNEDKTAFEILVFRAECAIRSILGKKPYTKVTNEYLMARMYGFRNIEDFQNSGKLELSRYLLDKIKFKLQNDWYLIYYSRQTRGFYVSYSLSLENLIYHAELKRESYKENELKRIKDEAYKNAIQRLKKPP